MFYLVLNDAAVAGQGDTMSRIMTMIIAVLASLGVPAIAQDAYPNRPISLVIGFPPGGAYDTVSRIFGDALSQKLGQPVLIINRPGAATTVAAGSVATAPPDGYTLYIGPASLFGGDKALYKSVSYEPKDFIPITRISASPLLLCVSKDSGITSVADLVSAGRKDPGKLFVGSGGSGSITHIAALQFQNLANVKFTHVPYKGGAQYVVALVAGDIQVAFATIASVQGMVDTGKAVGLAVTTPNRSPLQPKYPSIAEAGVPGYRFTNWLGLFAPANTPAAITNRLFIASVEVLRDPEVKQRLFKRGEEALPSVSMAEFKEFALREGAEYASFIKQSGVQVE